MNRELELTVRAEEAAGFVAQVAFWRSGEVVRAERTAPGAIRNEHERRVAAAGRVLEVASERVFGDDLELTAQDDVERLVLATVVDLVVSDLVEDLGRLDVTEYDELEAGAEALAYWSKVARDFNAGCDEVDELEGVVA